MRRIRGSRRFRRCRLVCRFIILRITRVGVEVDLIYILYIHYKDWDIWRGTYDVWCGCVRGVLYSVRCDLGT